MEEGEVDEGEVEGRPNVALVAVPKSIPHPLPSPSLPPLFPPLPAAFPFIPHPCPAPPGPRLAASSAPVSLADLKQELKALAASQALSASTSPARPLPVPSSASPRVRDPAERLDGDGDGEGDGDGVGPPSPPAPRRGDPDAGRLQMQGSPNPAAAAGAADASPSVDSSISLTLRSAARDGTQSAHGPHAPRGSREAGELGYDEIMQYVARGETPPNVRTDIDDRPKDPARPLPPASAPAPKPWHRTEAPNEDARSGAVGRAGGVGGVVGGVGPGGPVGGVGPVGPVGPVGLVGAGSTWHTPGALRYSSASSSQGIPSVMDGGRTPGGAQPERSLSSQTPGLSANTPGSSLTSAGASSTAMTAPDTDGPSR